MCVSRPFLTARKPPDPLNPVFAMRLTPTLAAAALAAGSLATLPGCAGDGDAIAIADAGLTPLSGSYSRLLAVGDYLYAVDATSVITFDATDRDDPVEVDREDVGLAVETIYHHEGNLFIGSRSAMYTYTITDDGTPERRGLFDYNTLNLPVEPCDPVVADANTAYATLYTDINQEAGGCGRTREVQSLVVMDITDLDRPSLVNTYDVVTPRGLALTGDYLYVCNDGAGFTVMDIADPADAREVAFVTDLEAWDAIVQGDLLMVVGTSELVQYDISDREAPVELSRLPLPRT